MKLIIKKNTKNKPKYNNFILSNKTIPIFASLMSFINLSGTFFVFQESPAIIIPRIVAKLNNPIKASFNFVIGRPLNATSPAAKLASIETIA